ncbi:Nucleoporin-17 [Dactylella cylindrospora]|nr:Nucleoporin-17 [Dactylella cylindrospora]
MSNNFEVETTISDAISSVNYSPSTTTHLLVTSWDQTIRLIDTHAGTNGRELVQIDTHSPLLDACFVGEDGKKAVAGGLDQGVKLLDLETKASTTLSSHDSAVKAVCWNKEVDTVISGSWDRTIHLHDPHTASQTSTTSVPHKIFSISTISNKLVVAMASRSIHIYDLRNMSEPFQRRESSLKFMTRTVRCMPNGEGYASSSIEGRVAVEFFDPSKESQSRKYAFKCHRQPDGDVDVVYPVNALAFHPVYGTFASGGGDGVVALWDGVAKRRLRQYQGYPASIAAMGFSRDGKYLAIASCNGFEDGKENIANGERKIFVREMGENEAKPKSLG